MRLVVRGAVAVALLVGIYLLCLGVVGLVVALGYLTVAHPTGADIRLTVIAGLACLAVLRGLAGAVMHKDKGEDFGLLVGRADQPTLWTEVDRLATEVGTRTPEEIQLIPQANAAVVEESSMLGLRAGRRRMYVGLPLVAVLTADELRAVLAHELGHYSGQHTRLGPLIRRGQVSLEHLIKHLSARPWTQRLFVGYTKLYFRVTAKVSRSQELEADATAARIAGTGAAVSALSRLPAIEAAWQYYLGEYVLPAVGHGLIPRGLLSGFHLLVEEPTRQEEMRRIDLARESAPSPYDTHPPLAARIAALTNAVETDSQSERLPVPARDLIRDVERLDEAFPAMLLKDPSLPSVSWDQVADKVGGTEARRQAAALRGAPVLAGDADANLGAVLNALAAGLSTELADSVRPGVAAADQVGALVDALTCMVACGLVDLGRARWSVSWSGASWGLVTDVDLAELRTLVHAAVDDPASVRALTRWLDRFGLAGTHVPQTGGC